MTGTNEIGAIYTGLATNMANVAQAEFYGSMVHLGNSNCKWTGNGASAIAADNDCTTYTKAGENLQPSTNVPAIQFTPVRSGNYQISVSAKIDATSTSSASCEIYANGSSLSPLTSSIYNTETFVEMRSSITIASNLTAATAYTFDIRCSATNAIPARSLAEQLQWTVYRFPTSSELVVTPERQNTFAGIKGVASGGTNNVSSAAWAKLTFGSTLTRTPFGKAKVETNNDYSVTVENMPVGSYLITAAGAFTAQASASGNTTECFFGISDTANSGPGIATFQVNSTGDVTSTTPFNPSSGLSGIYTNTSVANRTFFINAYRGAGGGNCFAFSDTNRAVTITISPLDQPSNSALYVEGPVKASATGAAIPAGYQGQVITTASAIATTTATLSETDVTNASFTLTPGVWQIFYSVTANYSSGTTSGNDGFTMVTITDSANTHIGESERIIYAITRTAAANQNYSSLAASAVVNVTGSTVYKLRLKRTDNGGIGSGAVENVSGAYGSTFYAIRIN
jgi:hypothetical protein